MIKKLKNKIFEKVGSIFGGGDSVSSKTKPTKTKLPKKSPLGQKGGITDSVSKINMGAI